MSILVNTQNEKEEKVLLAFLDSLQYQYELDIDFSDRAEFLNIYNKEINDANKDIEEGNFVSHDDVEKIIRNRRNQL